MIYLSRDRLILERQLLWYFNIHLLLTASFLPRFLLIFQLFHRKSFSFFHAASSRWCNGTSLVILDLSMAFLNILSSLSPFSFISVSLNYVSLVQSFTNDPSSFNYWFIHVDVKFYSTTKIHFPSVRWINNERARTVTMNRTRGKRVIVREKLKTSTIEYRTQYNALYIMVEGGGGVKFRGVSESLWIFHC